MFEGEINIRLKFLQTFAFLHSIFVELFNCLIVHDMKFNIPDRAAGGRHPRILDFKRFNFGIQESNIQIPIRSISQFHNSTVGQFHNSPISRINKYPNTQIPKSPTPQ